MTPQDFNNILQKRIELMRAVLDIKASEYSSNGDRLHNFKAAGRMLGVTPETALAGMLTKHLVSVFDMVRGLHGHQPSGFPAGLWAEKIGDAINYLCLLEGLVAERDGNVKGVEAQLAASALCALGFVTDTHHGSCRYPLWFSIDEGE